MEIYVVDFLRLKAFMLNYFFLKNNARLYS